MQFINRLTQFIALAGLLIAGNGLAAPAPTMTKTEFRDAMDKLWDANADEIATFLNEANPKTGPSLT